jgi:hypothetical protein
MLAAFQMVSRPLSDLRRTAKFARRLIRRHGVFRALRAVELVAYYRRYVQLLDSRPFALAVMSSHSNPHGIALNAAAGRFGIPVVLITHGMPVRPIARLDYELAILECEASRHVYVDAGCRMRRTVIKCRGTEYLPLPKRWPESWSRVAICLSKDPVADQVMASVHATRRSAHAAGARPPASDQSVARAGRSGRLVGRSARHRAVLDAAPRRLSRVRSRPRRQLDGAARRADRRHAGMLRPPTRSRTARRAGLRARRARLRAAAVLAHRCRRHRAVLLASRVAGHPAALRGRRRQPGRGVPCGSQCWELHPPFGASHERRFPVESCRLRAVRPPLHRQVPPSA